MGELRKEFLVQRQGKDFALYAGLLDLAHQEGLHSIETNLLQIPDDANGQTAIVKARVTMFGDMDQPKFFDGIGDASPANVAPMMKQHIIRMAETRAKARALRDATNIGVAALEEMADDEHDAPRPQAQATSPAAVVPDDVRAAGTEVVNSFVKMRKGLVEARTLDALRDEWKAINEFVKAERFPDAVLTALTPIKDARKAALGKSA